MTYVIRHLPNALYIIEYKSDATTQTAQSNITTVIPSVITGESNLLPIL